MDRAYRIAIYCVILLGVIHTALTPTAYPGLSAETLWFAGTGLMLAAVGLLNARLLADRLANGAWGIILVNTAAVLLSFGACVVIREPQAFLLLGFLGMCLIGSLRARFRRSPGRP